jgi:hypothetical protein
VTDDQILNHPDVKQLLQLEQGLRRMVLARPPFAALPVWDLCRHIAEKGEALAWRMHLCQGFHMTEEGYDAEDYDAEWSRQQEHEARLNREASTSPEWAEAQAYRRQQQL